MTSYHRINTDLEIFTSKLGTMCLRTRTLSDCISSGEVVDDLAVDWELITDLGEACV